MKCLKDDARTSTQDFQALYTAYMSWIKLEMCVYACMPTQKRETPSNIWDFDSYVWMMQVKKRRLSKKNWDTVPFVHGWSWESITPSQLKQYLMHCRRRRLFHAEMLLLMQEEHGGHREWNRNLSLSWSVNNSIPTIISPKQNNKNFRKEQSS